MKCEEIKKEFIGIFEGLSGRYNRHQIWSDFVIMGACAISNTCDKRFFAEREAMYTESAKHYTPEEVAKFAEMTALVVRAFERNPEQDFLGDLFGRLRLNNEWKGQFFTPYHIGKVMAEINTTNIVEQVKQKGIVSVNDPCCGAGGLLIAFANSVSLKGINFQKHIIFAAQDIDLIAGLMCYIQLSVLGCRGYVKIGNALTEPITEKQEITKDIWFTPMYRFGGLLEFMRIFHASKDKNADKPTDISA